MTTEKTTPTTTAVPTFKVCLTTKVGRRLRDCPARLVGLDLSLTKHQADGITEAMGTSLVSLDKRQAKKCLRFFDAALARIARRPDLWAPSEHGFITQMRNLCALYPKADFQVRTEFTEEVQEDA